MGSSRLDHSLGYHDSYYRVSYTASQPAGCGAVLAHDAASHRVSCSHILHELTLPVNSVDQQMLW